MKLFKWLFLLALIGAVFGGAYYYGNELFLKPRREIKDARNAPPPEPPPPPPDPSLPDVEKALALVSEGKQTEARALLEQILVTHPESTRITDVKKLLGEININDLFSPSPGPAKTEYVVSKGDSLAKIAGKTKSSAELIMRANNMDSTMLQIGQRLIVPQLPFTLLVDSDSKTVVLFTEGRFFKEYAATFFKVPGGKPPAPVTLAVTEKLAWLNGQRVAFGSKEYLDSTRWIQLNRTGITLFGNNPADATAARPATGIGLAPEDMEELHTVAGRGMVVELR